MPIPPRSSGEEVHLTGMGVSRGIAIGGIYLHDTQALTVPEYRIPLSKVAAEKARLAKAVDLAGSQVDALRTKVEGMVGAAGEEVGYLLEAYGQMLHSSRLIRGVIARIETDRINVEAALSHEIEGIARTFEAMEDPYLSARVLDIRDMGRRLLRNLTNPGADIFAHLPTNAIICAEELAPSETALLDPKRTAAIATTLGGAESHTAIMARSLGVPAVLGLAGLFNHARQGSMAIVDGRKGLLILNPTPSTLTKYRKLRADFLRSQRELSRLRDLPAVTLDNTRVQLHANIELPSEVDAILAAGAEGIGLFRTEFQFMNRDDLPSEDEQFAVLAELIKAMGGRTLTIRTLDVGGDKLARSLAIHPGPNPALGLRAVRLCLSRPELLRTQLTAILRASALGPVRILIPMVCSADEIATVRGMVADIADQLRRQLIPVAAPLPPVGIMIEIPGAALNADALAWRSDFFSIGTNDLTQYTLAIDRTDEAVAHLYNPLHPAVLRLIQFSAQAAMRARIPVAVCGEMAGDPRYTALLLGLGIRDLSMSASNIPVVKRRIRDLDIIEATRRAQMIMDQSESPKISQLLDEFNATLK